MPDFSSLLSAALNERLERLITCTRREERRYE